VICVWFNSSLCIACSRNLFIFGLSLLLGFSVCQWAKANPGVIQTGSPLLDEIITVLLETSMLIGGLTAAALDNVIPGNAMCLKA